MYNVFHGNHSYPHPNTGSIDRLSNRLNWSRRRDIVRSRFNIFLHLTMAQAGPIALLAIASAAGIGALLAHKNKTLRYKAAALMALSV